MTVVVGVVSLVVVFGVRMLAPKVPGALVLVVGGLLASWVFDLGAHGVALVGEVPRGLPDFQVPHAELGSHASTVAVAAVALVLIGFSQTAGDARTFAARHRYRIDINQESVAQGMANVGAGLFEGMPVSTSLSASSLNDHSGARTGLGRSLPAWSSWPPCWCWRRFSRAAEAGAGRPDHRGGGHGDDGRARDAPSGQGSALRLLDRGRRDHRHAPGRRARRSDNRNRPLADLADRGGDSPAHARPGTGARYPGFPGA